MQTNSTADLVLEQLPNGQAAWLRPALSPTLDRYVLDPERVVIVESDEDPRYVVTDAGRRALAMAALFGTRSEAICAACGLPEDAPDCATREHWGVA